MGKISKTFALFLTLIIAMSFLTLMMVKPVSAQPTTNTSLPTFTHLSNDHFTLVPEATMLIGIQIQQGDHIKGTFAIGNFHYYPNNYIGGHGELITYQTSLSLTDPKDHTIYDFNGDTKGSFDFTALYSGSYSIPAYCSYIWGVKNPIAPELTLTYTVTGTPMKVNILSPSNQIYAESNLSLTFTVNRPVDWAGYNLNGAKNVTLWDSHNGNPPTANTTLADLAVGAYSLTLYANDTWGNMDNKTVTFTVEKPHMEFFGNTVNVDVNIAIASMIIMTLLIVGLLLYRRHRKPIT